MADDRPAWETDPAFLDEYRRQYPHEAVADSILRLRVDMGWTQQELGERVGTSQSVIARAESGRHSFQIDLLRRIAEAADATCHLVFIPREGDDQSIISLANVPKSKASAYHVVVDADEQAGAPIQPLTANAGG